MDPKFRVEVVSQTSNSQTVCYLAAHQDYSEKFVAAETDLYTLSEQTAGERVVKHLLKGGRGHWGPVEHPQIVFNVGYFPHSVMQQARTHRVGVSFDVQSFRYTGDRIIAVADGDLDVEDVFYFRPEGAYRDREGNKYNYTKFLQEEDKDYCEKAAYYYKLRIQRHGFSPEHARGMIPFDIRQHFVFSGNLRAMLHFMDMRSKADAQLEIQWLCELIWPHLKAWAPEICQWYEDNRLGKARLAP